MSSPGTSPSSSGSASPPPLEHVDDELVDTIFRQMFPVRSNATDPFAPWLEAIAECSARWALLPTHNNRLGVLIELRVDVTDPVLDADDEFEHLLQLREAIDLVVLMLAAEPTGLRALLKNKFGESMSEKRDMDADAISAVMGDGVRTELRLRFEFKSIKTRLLDSQLATHFIRELGAELSANEEFRQLRERMLDQLGADEAALNRVRQLTVPITMAIDSDELDQISLLDADDFFVHLTAFCKTLVDIRTQAHDSQWVFATSHVPLVVESIDLTLQRFCITHNVTQAAKAFMNAGMPIQLKQLSLDPRLISCSDNDVREFVATLRSGASSCRIATGVDPNEDLPETIDEHGQDRRDTIRLILGAVVQVEEALELHLGGLLTLCAAPHNRQEVWRLLFNDILSREVPLENLVIERDVVLEPEDRQWIREGVDAWRLKNPGKKLFIKKLHLQVLGTETDDIEHFLNAIDDLECIMLENRDGGNFPPRILHRLLSYPSIKRLRVGRLVVPSMEVFDPSVEDPDVPTKPALEQLVLEDLILQDRSSMPRFLEKLRGDVDEPSPLAKTLTCLQVTQYACGWDEMYKWDEAAVDALDRVLSTNRVLREAHVVIDLSDTPTTYEKRLLKHNKTHVRAPLEMRQSAIAKARNLAFLSAIRSGGHEGASSAKSLLDTVAVTRILAFAGPHQLHKINVQAWEDF